MTSEITILGLGVMGSALAAAQLDAGRSTTVWNRSPREAPRGATVAPDPRAAVAASPLVVVCVVDNAAAREVLEAAGDALSGRVVVNLTNGTPAQAREIAAWVQERGGRYLDGGIMAVPPMIATPAASIFYSGDAGALDEHRATLATFGAVRYTGADPGAAATWDLALLSAMYGMFAGVMQAVALGRAQGIAATELMPAVQGWLTAIEGGLPEFAEVVEGASRPATSPLAMQAQGFVNLLEASRESGVRSDLLAPVGALLEEAVAAGLGDEDVASMVALLAVGDPARPLVH